MTNQDEQLIINNILAGDRNSFGILVDRYQDMAYAIAVRLLNDPDEAADIVQESFVKSYEVLATFKGEAKFSTWIYRIVYRKSLDRLKAMKRKRTAPYEDMEGIGFMEEEGATVDQVLMEKERKDLIKNAIARLKPEEQTLILLYYFEESSIKEIAGILGLSMENVKVRLFRIRKKLYDLLKGQVEHIT